MNSNEITNINILEKLDFKNLREIDLSYNKISDIKILEKVRFKNLKILNLQNNDYMCENIEIIEKIIKNNQLILIY